MAYYLYFLIGQVFEKYHAIDIGYPGGGGEYTVQEGFGWTNGVTLWILNKFGGNLTAPLQCLNIRHDIKMKHDKNDIGKEMAATHSPINAKRISAIALYILMKIGLFFRFF